MKKKMLYFVIGVFLLTSMLIYASYGCVKIFSVTDNATPDTSSSSTYYYFTQSGSCFVSTQVGASGGADVQVHLWGSHDDDYIPDSAIHYDQGGPYQLNLPLISPGNYVTITVLAYGSGSATSDLWQWQQ